MIPIKSKEDIEGMRRSCRAVAKIRDKLAAMVAPGITTGEIDRYAASLIKDIGGTSAFLNYRGFPGNICISLNEEVVHGIGSERKLIYGDVVKLDVGIVLDGWVGDTAISVGVGAVSPEVERLMRRTEESLYLGIAKALNGRRLGDISSAIENHVVSGGYSVVRDFVGHGVGRRLHEEPQIPNYGKAATGPKLKTGMTLAIEPMVNLGRNAVKILKDGWTVVTVDAKPSAHYEHTILITENEPEILTQGGKE
ncbi:MAG: type I methionyl aminopeptidase [Verrucomicrobiota bacterium]